MPITHPVRCACGLIRQLLQARTLVKVVAFPRPAVVNGASATGFLPRGITLRGGTMRTRPNEVWLHGNTLLLLLANFQQARNASIVLSSRDSGSTVGLLLRFVLRINHSFDRYKCLQIQLKDTQEILRLKNLVQSLSHAQTSSTRPPMTPLPLATSERQQKCW